MTKYREGMNLHQLTNCIQLRLLVYSFSTPMKLRGSIQEEPTAGPGLLTTLEFFPGGQESARVRISATMN